MDSNKFRFPELQQSMDETTVSNYEDCLGHLQRRDANPSSKVTTQPFALGRVHEIGRQATHDRLRLGLPQRPEANPPHMPANSVSSTKYI